MEFNSKETIILLSDLNTSDEETVKSTITLCLNYLRQTSQQQVEVAAKVQEEDDDLEEGELERRQQAVTEWKKKNHDSNLNGNNNKNDVTMDELSLSSSTCSSLSPSSPAEEEQEATFIVDDEHSNFCTNCKQLLTQLDQQIEQKAYLKRDLSCLASALADEEDLRSTIEQDKEALEQDVADITSSLFLLLNQIIMDEVTDRDGIIQLHRETQGKLNSVLDAWDQRDGRLKELKDILVELDSVVHSSANSSATITRRYSQFNNNSNNNNNYATSRVSNYAANSSTTIHRLANRTSSMLNTSFSAAGALDIKHHHKQQNGQGKTIRIDGFILNEFQHHFKTVLDSNTTAIPVTPFVKRVLQEDVEPCLFFSQSQGWWKSPWFKKKLLDAISKNKCEIQPWHDQYYQHTNSIFSNTTTTTTTTSSSTTNSNSVNTSPSTSHVSTTTTTSSSMPPSKDIPMPPKTKCACCNILRVCEFKMRLPIPPNTTTTQQKVQQQPWLPIDRFCRDRLVAVCGYYSFMSHLKMLSSSSILNMFKQVMYHRRKMTLARIGSIGLFLEEELILEELDEMMMSTRRPSSSSTSGSTTNNASTTKQQYQQRRRSRRNRESIVLDHSGSGSDTASVVSISDMQGLDGISAQIVIVH